MNILLKNLLTFLIIIQLSFSSVNGNCQPDNICQECQVAANICTSCFPNSTFYLNQTTLSCDTCSKGCRSCTSSNECQICFEQYFLNSTSKQCQSCSKNCKACDEEGCTLCGEYTYMAEQKQCADCPTGCMQCDNNYTCLSNACIQWGFYYDDTLFNCMQCKEGCIQCENAETCLNSASCKLNYFFDESSRSCSQCSEGCLRCNNPTTCFKEFCDIDYQFNYETENCEICSSNNESINCQNQIQNNSEIIYYQVFQNKVNMSNVTYSHMSMIEYLPNNTIAVAFQASAYGEGNFDQSIYLTFSYDNGQTWTPYQIIKLELYAMWGPILYWCPIQQKLWLFYSASVWEIIRSPYRTYPGGSVKYITSSPASNFTQWSSPVEILPYASDIWGTSQKMTGNKMISFQYYNTQRWVLPFWVQVDSNYDPGQQNCGVLISDDFGDSWYPYGPLTNYDEWLLENSVAYLSNSQLYQVFRSSTKVMWESYSNDFGITWTEAKPSEISNPDSKFSMITLHNENQFEKATILAFNPSTNSRSPLSLAYTQTNAQTWVQFAMLENYNKNDGYSYPTSQQIGNQIYTTYTDNAGISLAIANISEILYRKKHIKNDNNYEKHHNNKKQNENQSWFEYLEWLLFEDHTKSFFEKLE